MVVRAVWLRGFRGVREGRLGLAPLTILVGPNNSGKTTLLEALLLAHGFGEQPYTHAPDVPRVLSFLHRTLGSEGLDHLLYRYGGAMNGADLAYFRDGDAFLLRIRLDAHSNSLAFRLYGGSPDGVRACWEGGLDPDDAGLRFRGGAERARFASPGGGGALPGFMRVLFLSSKLVDGGFRFLRTRWIDFVGRGLTGRVAEWVSGVAGESYVDLTLEPFGGGREALYFYRSDRVRVRAGDVGDGVQMLALARLLYEYMDPEVLLWDDVESHMNPRALALMAGWIADIIEGGRQVVVTTHSLEAVRVIGGLAPEGKARIVGLRLVEGRLEAREMGLRDVEEMVQLGLDVRV